jgi:hypothetical protein
MAQGVDPEFKSQYHKTKQNTENTLLSNGRLDITVFPSVQFLEQILKITFRNTI